MGKGLNPRPGRTAVREKKGDEDGPQRRRRKRRGGDDDDDDDEDFVAEEEEEEEDDDEYDEDASDETAEEPAAEDTGETSEESLPIKKRGRQKGKWIISQVPKATEPEATTTTTTTAAATTEPPQTKTPVKRGRPKKGEVREKRPKPPKTPKTPQTPKTTTTTAEIMAGTTAAKPRIGRPPKNSPRPSTPGYKYVKIDDRRTEDGEPIMRKTKTQQLTNEIRAAVGKVAEECQSHWEKHDGGKEPLFPERMPPRDVTVLAGEDAESRLPVGMETKKVRVDDRTPATEIAPLRGECIDGVLAANVGGPIWALDWCPSWPAASVDDATDQYVAVSCHHDGIEHPQLRCSEKKPNVIQIWRLPRLFNKVPSSFVSFHFVVLSPSSLRQPTTPNSEAPVFALGLVHGYDTAWDLKWCPVGTRVEPSEGGAPSGRLGLLAAVFSTGHIAVFSVPFPSSVRQKDSDPTKPVICELAPSFGVDLGGSYATSVAWSPYPSDILLVGCSDGHCRAWSVKDESLLFDCACAPDGVRSVSWSPTSKNYFVASVQSQTQSLQLWSLDNPFAPAQIFLPAGLTSYHRCLWTPANAVVLGGEDGYTTMSIAFSNDQTNSHRYSQSAIWDMSLHLDMLQVAQVCSEGKLVSFGGLRSATRRKKSKQIDYYNIATLSRATDDNGEYVLTRKEQMEMEIATGGTDTQITMDKTVSLNRVSWCHSKHASKWIAFGGNLGVLFIHHPKQMCPIFT